MDTACELSWYFIGEIRLIEMYETKPRVPIFFFFFSNARAVLAIYRLEIGSSFRIEFTRKQELRADVTLKMNFHVQCSQLWWDACDFFFHDLELLVTCRVIDNRWRQLNENHWHLEIEFSLRDTFHYYINGWIWILSFFLLLYTRVSFLFRVLKIKKQIRIV